MSFSAPLLSKSNAPISCVEQPNNNIHQRKSSEHISNLLLCRRALYSHVISTKMFQCYILLTIALNLISISIDSFISPEDSSIKFELIQRFFLVLFAIEMLLKMIAFGVIRKVNENMIPFFYHPFHIFDLSVILLSWITFESFNITLTAIRAIFIIFFIPIAGQ